jgi:hypothetical protein
VRAYGASALQFLNIYAVGFVNLNAVGQGDHGGLCPLSYGTKIEMENGKWKMKYKRIKKQK